VPDIDLAAARQIGAALAATPGIDDADQAKRKSPAATLLRAVCFT
jgi:hypothetical protein